MARATKAEKALEKAFHETYNRLGNGVQVNIMDLGNLQRFALDAVKNGSTMDQAVQAAIDKYRKN